MAIKSYIRGFGTYPLDTREMMTNTNAILSAAAIYALSAHNVTLQLSAADIQWTYFGSQAFVTVLYTASA